MARSRLLVIKSHQITLYMKARAKGYKVVWVGQGLICFMIKH